MNQTETDHLNISETFEISENCCRFCLKVNSDQILISSDFEIQNNFLELTNISVSCFRFLFKLRGFNRYPFLVTR